ncbi:ectoine/hydroxyectoine ABC transporter substrate-binding protein EhuB [Ornithinimicrobium sp. CNJ-824]|uniref:transporter substrate-binding domain-containing protein n=1 Tax=Ornithinimicrobium sp. CNJ-824 TaxID=1904966 RepID=UPI0009652D18|nr:transporter substrate-binding domain-containing protein [Ornithinimicrobium sp. CNJ-824]OLT23967.1 ectoine/hydroxyectoine ABC transporter substrate-binding protein EhuB [Ornithinimicrobium sp. CNJ-824]
MTQHTIRSGGTPARRRVSLIAAVAAAGLGLAACGDGGDTGGEGGGDEEASTLERLQEEGTIRVAFAGEIPYSYEEDGELTGATIALDREIFAAMGIDEVDGQLVEWDALIPGLNAGEYDAVSAGMSILPDRCERAAFAEPTIMYTSTLMVPEGNPEGLSDFSSFEGNDLTLAVQSGAIEQGFADDIGLENTMTVNSAQDGMDAVSSGRADAFSLTNITLSTMVEENPDAGVETVGGFVAEVDGVKQISAGSTVFRPEDTELLEAYNEELATVVGDADRFEEVVGEFGFTDAERPPEGLTAQMLCDGDLEAANEAADQADG